MEQNPQASANTGTRDETYDLIAVVYHALQGAENCQIYAGDAQRSAELRQFFGRARDMQKQLADEGKRLLHGQMHGSAEAGREGSAFFGGSSSSSGTPLDQQRADVAASHMSDRSADPTRNSEMSTGGGGTSTF